MHAAPLAHHDLLELLAAEPDCSSRASRLEVLQGLGRLRSWLAEREAALLAVSAIERDAASVGARDTTQLVQQQCNVGHGEARRVALRATHLRSLPSLAAALAAGLVGPGQVDEVCALAERLEPQRQGRLRALDAELASEFSALTPRRARVRCQELQREWDRDDGRGRHERQRAANGLRLAKTGDGCTKLSGQLDPESGAELQVAIDAKVTELWRRQHAGSPEGRTPVTALTNEALRAEALLELIRQGTVAGSGRNRPSVIVLIDHDTLLGQMSESPRCELDDGTPVPAETARRLACEAGILPVVLDGRSQPLDVGRAARLATTGQRAALRAAHDTCAADGCEIPFRYCDIHHLRPWEVGGLTDLANLVPLCSKHHHLVHEGARDISVDGHRVVRFVADGDPPRGRNVAPSDRRPPSDAHAFPMRC